ncbi:MAG: ribosome maturation factor RimM [Lachnospiraceae bacterium]|nr:ribosome maturation factor RimM [Lachnospiraceae bacterium]
MEDMLQVGVITSPHGVHGEVKVFPTTDDNRRFKKLKDCFIDTGKECIPAVATGCKFFKNMVILKFEGYDNPDDVQKLRQCPIMVTRENAVPLGEDECFISDIIGYLVVTEEGERLGILDEVLTTRANDVYVVKKDNGKELLIPVIKQCVKKINFDAQRITVKLMEGMDS